MPVLSTLGAATAKAWGFLQQAAGGAADLYFNYVTMLLTGNGTNGAQNNTFLDSSTNAFSITRNGNTTQGSFSPYGSNWGNYFNGSSSLQFSGSNLALGSGDFTVEGWFYTTIPVTGNYQCLFGIGTYPNWLKIGIGAYPSGDALYVNGTYYNWYPQTYFTANQWNHIAVVRNSGTIKVYVNGTSVFSVANSNTITSTGTSKIADNPAGAGESFYGYVSNFRVVVGTALYTANFTPSTTPLTVVSGTQLLTCQNNRFIDNSANAFALTINGTPSVQRFSPFNPTASYDTATIGGSGYFDGSGDDLTTPTNAAFNPAGDFTMEGWMYIPLASSISGAAAVMGTTGGNLNLDTDSAGKVTFYGGTYPAGVLSTSNGAFKFGMWNHLAATRSGSTVKVWVNGVESASGTPTVISTSRAMTIGVAGGSNRVTGYISDARFVSGTAVYTTAFTPPTSPLTAVTNTALLLNMTNAGIPDSAMMNDLETVGNAQVSTTQAKFGTASMYFDGTGDALKCVNNPNLQYGAGDFTVECWVYPAATGGSLRSIVSHSDGSSAAGSQFILRTEGSNTSTVLAVYSGGTPYVASWGSGLTANQWTHVAAVRSGSTLSLYVGGTQRATANVGTSSLNAIPTIPLSIGSNNDSGTDNWNGYIDDLRITKGYARYTGSTYTVPTAAFPTY